MLPWRFDSSFHEPGHFISLTDPTWSESSAVAPTRPPADSMHFPRKHPFGSLAPLRTGAREGVMRERDMLPDQNFSVNGHGHLKIQMVNWRNTLASTMQHASHF